MTFPVERNFTEMQGMNADLSLFTWYGFFVWMGLKGRSLSHVANSKTGRIALVKDACTGRRFIQVLEHLNNGTILPGTLVQYTEDCKYLFGA